MGKTPMIRVGFIGAVSKEWMGGLNYYKNLLFAIAQLSEKQIEPIVFLGTKTDEEIKAMFREYAQVVEDPIFDRKSIQWFMWRSIYHLFGSSIVLEKLLISHRIQVLSHARMFGLKSCKSINWIPDFQHLHLPQMFSSAEIKQRNKIFTDFAQYSDAIILSSYDALSDFKAFAPQYSHKAKVLQFVSQPDKQYFELDEAAEEQLRNKYKIFTPFFYLPNQFWKHKNHMVVFEAVKILKDKGIETTIVCTGHLHDYRNSEHIDNLTSYIITHGLNEQIKLLGLVDYADVFAFIKFSEAVVNPSLFEGWSSTVEECKSVGKNMILSDLNVHKEQYPEAYFFARNDSKELAQIFESYNHLSVKPNQIFDLKSNTRAFAQTYEAIVIDTQSK